MLYIYIVSPAFIPYFTLVLTINTFGKQTWQRKKKKQPHFSSMIFSIQKAHKEEHMFGAFPRHPCFITGQ